MRSIKGISVFLTLAVSLLASTIGAQAQISSGAPTKLVLINSFNDFASVQPAQNQNSVVVVRYGNTVGDQLGGMFAYDPDSVAAGDSKNVFVPASGVGRFVRYDSAAYVPGIQTANRVIVTDGSGNVGTDPQLTFNGADLTVGGNLTVTTVAAGSTDNVVTKSAGNVLQTRQVNPDVWNLAADLAGDSENLAAGTKILAPSVYLDGSNDYIEIADNAKLTFATDASSGTVQGTWSAATNTPFLTDGVGTSGHYYIVTAAGTQNLGSGSITYAIGDLIKYDGSIWYYEAKDDLPFSGSAWVKSSTVASTFVFSKWGTTAATREYSLSISSGGDLRMDLIDIAGNTTYRESDAALTAHDGEWVHIAWTYGGAGPNSDSAFSAAASEITLYVNGVSVPSTATNSASYAGMSNTSQAAWVGRQSSSYGEGHVKDIKIFNRELSASEVATLAQGNDLGYSEEWGGAFGGAYTSDYTSNSTDGWSASEGAINATTTVGGDADNIQYTINAATSASHYLSKASVFTSGISYFVSMDVFIPSGQSTIDGFKITSGGGNAFITQNTPTTGSWVTYFGVNEANSTSLFVQPLDGGVQSITDAGGDDTISVRNVEITRLGGLVDLRSERFSSGLGKWYDLSSNAFVGVNNGASISGREVPVFDVGTFSPGISFGGGSTGVTYVQQPGFYTRIGDTCYVTGMVQLSAKGSSTGALKVTGLPFTSFAGGPGTDLLHTHMTNAASLTSQPVLLVDDGGTGATMSDISASGQTSLTEANATDTLIIRFSGTYKIQ